MNKFETQDHQDPLEAHTYEPLTSGLRNGVFAAVSALFLTMEACVPLSTFRKYQDAQLAKIRMENQIKVDLSEKLDVLETFWRDVLRIYFNQPDAKTLNGFYEVKEMIKKSALFLIKGASKLPNSPLKDNILQRCDLILKQANGIIGGNQP